ncbi:glycoside hydrolase family 3 protein [Butyrivibrio sp. AE3006]|uniref:glycoside hydrolase family 3 protein n=1 Tax=Butyrivibrio sp. AE3006 TaxID=1280673 RepID=UPI00040AC830|nr:glycoside hydrolase family 3 protein [Butyrivibrio sp. AE3006]
MKYQDEKVRLSLAREIATEAMVLLKNDDAVLPLEAGKKVALLGRTQNATIIGGGGSGASHSDNTLQIRDELVNAGLKLDKGFDKYYQNVHEKEVEELKNKGADFAAMDLEGLVASGIIYELFGKYQAVTPEPVPENELFESAAKDTDTAIMVIGRQTGGEECDRRIEDDYLLTDAEKSLVDATCNSFEKVIVVLNVNGMIDTSWIKSNDRIKAAIFMGTSGEQAAGALADLISGKAYFSGKLSQTAALAYEDYPTAEHFSFNKDEGGNIKTYEDYGLSASENGSEGKDVSPVTVYAEDMYVGYRYFDSFEKKVAYPFGFGLTYAEFDTEVVNFVNVGGRALVSCNVTNKSDRFAGKETIQLYVHKPFGKEKNPYKELVDFEKTFELAPGASENIALSFDLGELAVFVEDEKGGNYVIEKGEYILFLGNSSDSAKAIAKIVVAEEIVTKELSADIGMKACNKDKIKLICPEKEKTVEDTGNLKEITISKDDVIIEKCEKKEYSFENDSQDASGKTAENGNVIHANEDSTDPKSFITLADVIAGRASMEALVSQMSVKELAVLCNGFGPGLPFGGIGQKAPVTIQYDDGTDIGRNSHPEAMPGYINPAIDKYGIFSCYYKDGPASVGKTAWPTGMMIACTFNKGLAYEFGSACGREAEELKVSAWLAPGLNIIRNPIEGRAFEYFSEDPFVCGTMGTQICKGAIENNQVTTCPKHFALNEQETYRRGSLKKNIDAVDSIVSARAAREIYLKPFEMVIKNSDPVTIMSSFNKINGTFAGGNHVLCTEILRGEWGYEGVVVTDWGDMDFVVDGADAVAAGNDVVMPGGPPVIQQVLKGYDEGRVTLDELRIAVIHLLNYVKMMKDYSK